MGHKEKNAEREANGVWQTKGMIKVESIEGEGTTLTVLLPLGKDYLKPEEICETEKEMEDCQASKVYIAKNMQLLRTKPSIF